jgi:hypothetical protein
MGHLGSAGALIDFVRVDILLYFFFLTATIEMGGEEKLEYQRHFFLLVDAAVPLMTWLATWCIA